MLCKESLAPAAELPAMVPLGTEPGLRVAQLCLWGINVEVVNP